MSTDDEPPPAALAAEASLEVMMDTDGEVSAEATAWLPSRAFVADWTARALAPALDEPDAESARAPGPIRRELSVRLLAPEAMRALNREWRGRDRPTNVLSFPAGLPALPLEEGGSVQVLGDLAFCPAVIAREAGEQGKSLEAHWAHLVVHGVLHLRGLDHEEEDEASDMEALECRLLARHGIPDPYLARAPDGRPSAP